VNKKFLGTIVALLMVLCTVQLAEPAAAQPTSPKWYSQYNEANNQIVGPQPAYLWRKIDQGQRFLNQTTKIEWKTYRFRYNYNHVWINSTQYNRTNNANNNNINNQNNWNWNHWRSWNNWNNWNRRNNNNINNNQWSINSITITHLDKINWRVLRITKNTYDPQGNPIGTSSVKYIYTRLNAVRYYWIFRNSLVIPTNNFV